MEFLTPIRVPIVVVLSVVFGVVAHEASHAVVLRAAGVTCAVELLPDDESGGLDGLLGGGLVRITPTRIPEGLSPWFLRSAALMPLVLALPLVLVLLGVLPDPFTVGGLPAQVALIVWVGCAIPSPRDFSLAWYPERAIVAATERS